MGEVQASLNCPEIEVLMTSELGGSYKILWSSLHSQEPKVMLGQDGRPQRASLREESRRLTCRR